MVLPFTLNTYAKYLDYFTLKPRQRSIRNDVLAIEFPKAVTLLAGRVWIGYDEGSKFEAALSIWLQPKVSLVHRLWRTLSGFLAGPSLPPDRPLYHQSRFETIRRRESLATFPIGGIPSKVPDRAFSGNVYVGGVYLHRHYALTSQQDYYPLNELHALKPVRVNAGSRVIVNRDIFNIHQTKTFNAWDCEVLLIVDE